MSADSNDCTWAVIKFLMNIPAIREVGNLLAARGCTLNPIKEVYNPPFPSQGLVTVFGSW